MAEEFSYDAVPYPSKFFLQTHPDRLAAAGILYGMQPAPVENCRVLELTSWRMNEISPEKK